MVEDKASAMQAPSRLASKVVKKRTVHRMRKGESL